MRNPDPAGPIPTLLRKLRSERGLSQNAACALIGTAQAMLSFWETGRSRPNAKSLAKIAAAYGVDVAVFR